MSELYGCIRIKQGRTALPQQWTCSITAHTDETNLEYKGLVEDRVQCFLVHFGVKLLLLFRQELDFNVRIRGTAWVHGHEVCRLKDANCELWAQEVWGWQHSYIRKKSKVCEIHLCQRCRDCLCNVSAQLKPCNQSPQTSFARLETYWISGGFIQLSRCHNIWKLFFLYNKMYGCIDLYMYRLEIHIRDN